jgi:UDP-N-acetylmuramoyl-L-alanyl-D-glutamate--2,6-diaminopimelate ligase
VEIRTLIEAIPGAALSGDPATPVRGLAYDSRKVEPGFLFAALRGQRADGSDFVEQAITRGATAVLSCRPRPERHREVAWVRVDDERLGLALAARNYYGRPDERLLTIGITGTNGKTTVAYLLEAILREAGRRPCLIGTVVYRCGRDEIRAERTTPESLDLMRLLDRFVTAGARSCAMEVSSHSLALHRVAGIRFGAAVFTNLTQDHLDFHGTMEAYFESKALLFDGLAETAVAVLNADDPWSGRVRRRTRARVVTFGENAGADVRIAAFRPTDRGSAVALEIAPGVESGAGAPGGAGGRIEADTHLIGRPNTRNLAAAAACALALGLPREAVERALAQVRGVPGRFERVDGGGPIGVMVDYAHTDDALINLLAAVREIGPRRIITVFGCGGDRDRAKRPKMGRAAAQGSDVVVVTSDNPRSESPMAIIEEILPGVRQAYGLDPGATPDPQRCLVIPDRKEAIRKALSLAGADDCVVIAGKGHETYQILGDRTVPFDDREVAREILRARPRESRDRAAR